jgi:DNA primase
MNIERVLSVLEKVKPCGADKWQACCPAHDDKNPSLSIAVKEDKVLFHCFSGCSGDDIVTSLNAMGVEYDALFPESTEHHKSFFPKPKHTPTEKHFIVAMAKEKRARGERLTPDEKKAEFDAYLAIKRAG